MPRLGARVTTIRSSNRRPHGKKQTLKLRKPRPAPPAPVNQTAPLHTLLGRACVAAGCLLSAPSFAAAPPEPVAVTDGARRTALIRLVRQDCGACHGLTLQGGLGPALLPSTLADKPSDSLSATILQGRPGSAMPPWQRFLSQAEADWIVANLKKGFPNEH